MNEPRITAADIEKLSAWIAKRWPAAPAIDQAQWFELFSAHGPSHFRHACDVFKELSEVPTIPKFALACLTIGHDLQFSRRIVREGFKAWRQYWKDKHAGEDAAAARQEKRDADQAGEQSALPF